MVGRGRQPISLADCIWNFEGKKVTLVQVKEIDKVIEKEKKN